MLPWGPTDAPDRPHESLGIRSSVRNALTPTRQSSVGNETVPDLFDVEELDLESALGPVQPAREEHQSSEDPSEHDRSVGGKWKKRDANPASQGPWAPSLRAGTVHAGEREDGAPADEVHMPDAGEHEEPGYQEGDDYLQYLDAFDLGNDDWQDEQFAEFADGCRDYALGQGTAPPAPVGVGFPSVDGAGGPAVGSYVPADDGLRPDDVDVGGALHAGSGVAADALASADASGFGSAESLPPVVTGGRGGGHARADHAAPATAPREGSPTPQEQIDALQAELARVQALHRVTDRAFVGGSVVPQDGIQAGLVLDQQDGVQGVAKHTLPVMKQFFRKFW